jgi:hypothetical protein
VNVDNFVLLNSRCAGGIRILSSLNTVEKGSPVTFTVLCSSGYSWNNDDVVSKGDNIYEVVPTANSIYSVISQQENCPVVSSSVAINVIEPKVIEDKDTAIVRKEELKVVKEIAHRKKSFRSHRVNGRRFKVQETVTVSNSEIKLLVWDKNKVDGDKISLYLNGELLEDEFAVNKTKKEITLDLIPGKNVIVMYAINLGTIPPNTAIMSINNGHRPKLITLVSDLKKSGALEIIYDPVAFTGK